MNSVDLDLLVTPGLGDTTYLVTSGDEAAAIDPQRDVARLLDAARDRGATIRYAIETHVHNDYVSGAAELRAATGAEIVGPAGAGYAFGHRPVAEGDEIAVGEATLVALEAPGHTFEHTAYLLRGDPGEEPSALFSGGSLIVGSAGRTDLLGPEHAEELARMQFRTMRRLAELSDDVAVLPTHGAGSFCATTPPGERRTSSLGAERHTNPALATADETAFVRQQLTGLSRFPRYYAHMAPINRAGPDVLGDVPRPPARTTEEVAALLAGGAWVVDARDGRAFAAAHVLGSLNVPLEDSFASYVGWLVPFGSPLVLVAEGTRLAEAELQLFRIGFDRLEGHLAGGIDAWRDHGGPLGSYPTITVGDLVGELRRGDAGDVVDVRQASEWDAGHLEGSRHVFVGDVGDRLDAFDPSATTTLACASGYRASMAASLLDRAGLPVRLLARSGVPRVLHRLERDA